MSDNETFDIVARLPKLEDLWLDEILALDRSVLATVINRLLGELEGSDGLVSAFQNSL